MAITDKNLETKGILLVLSSPSGAGKSTLSKLLRNDLNLYVSVSATTRLPRGSEENGVDYYFLTKEKFEEEISAGHFAEYAQVHGNYYGTYKKIIYDSVEHGYDLLFDIDYKGMLQLKQQMPLDVVSVFILPPSMDKLSERLCNRSEDSESEIVRRLITAREEIKQCVNYDYVLVNNTVEDSYNKLKNIYMAEKLKRERASSLNDFISELLA